MVFAGHDRSRLEFDTGAAEFDAPRLRLPHLRAACTLMRCCGCRPGFCRPARILSIVTGLPVNNDKARLLRKIWPPPSPIEPSILTISAMKQIPGSLAWCSMVIVTLNTRRVGDGTGTADAGFA